MLDVAAKPSDPASLPVDPRQVRRTALEILYRGKASHVGSSMSTIEMLTAMYAAVDVEKIRRQDPDRSRIIVSKGHCAAATYATMHHYGLIPRDLLMTYHQEGSMLAGLVCHKTPYVEHSTGSLGHGLSVAAGCALALRNRGVDDASVLALVGDGEIHEGSIWEALMLAAHHRLSNFITLVDNNRISMITHTHKVLDLRPLCQRFAGFGLRALEVDGHDAVAVLQAIRECRTGDVPGVIICNTVKGKGVPVAEDQPIWHYRTLNDQTYQEILRHLDSIGQ